MTQHPVSPFDAIRHEDEHGNEYWSAREMGKLLGYGEYRFFKNAIQKAEEACKQREQPVSDHFVHTHGMVTIGSKAKRKVEEAIRKHRSYETPEILAVDVRDGNADYLHWVNEETHQKGKIV